MTLHKKGNFENPGNYRAIALLDSLYELYASLLQKRIADGSGTSVQEVNQLIKQFSQMGKMMKMMQGGGAKQMMQMMKGKGGMTGIR